MTTVRVELDGPSPDRSYNAHVGGGSLSFVAPSLREKLGDKPTRAMIVRDAGVPTAFLNELRSECEAHGFGVSVFELDPTERLKSIDSWQSLLTAMASSGHSRLDPVIALGGGIVGDLAGFAAASYQRGVPVAQCPSTLLSMVDASVGGKTGVNLSSEDRLLKNMVGAFCQPVVVAADTRLLESLDDRHLRAGLAECVKHAMISMGVAGEDLLEMTANTVGRVVARDIDATDELIRRSVALKAAVVRRDETESHEGSQSGAGGTRMLLNLGHTFGHAIETIPEAFPVPGGLDLAPLHHGEAVAVGMVAASATAANMGLCETAVQTELEQLLVACGLPTRAGGLPDADAILTRMQMDKKASGGSVRLVLPTGRGACSVIGNPDLDAVRSGIARIRD